MDKSKVYLASDHNGNAARAYLVKKLNFCNTFHEFIDLGPEENEGKVDYVDFAVKLCMKVTEEAGAQGILICGTGTGMSIAANKCPGIRAGLATDVATAELMREHNDCNVLVLGQWRNSLTQIEEMTAAFLTTKFAEGRHVRRIDKLIELDDMIDEWHK